MKNKRLGFLLVVITLFSCAYYNTLFNAKKNFELGLKEVLKNPAARTVPPTAKKYFQTTIDKSWKLIDLYSDKSKWADDALLYIAKSEYYLQKYSQAKNHLETFLKKYPNSELVPEAYLWLGKVYLKLKKYEQADEAFFYAIENAASSRIRAEAYFEKGLDAFNREDYNAANEFFLKAMEEKPDDEYRALLQFYLAETFYIQKRYEEAIKQYKKVMKFSPTVDIEYRTKYHLALSLIQEEKYKEAKRILTRMLNAPRFKKFYSKIRNALAEIYLGEGDIVAAVDTYREVLNSRTKDEGVAEAAFKLGKLFEFTIHDVDSAVYYYGKVKRIYPRYDSVEVAENKRRFLSELKQIRDAIKYDAWLEYQLENDPVFRDSLYKEQALDSLRQLGLLEETPDTLFNVFNADSARKDSLRKSNLKQPLSAEQTESEADTARKAQALDPITGEPLMMESPQKSKTLKKTTAATGNQKTTKKDEKQVERRKLPQIKHDLMQNRFQLAAFYFLKVQNYDSAMKYFNAFLEQYQDTVLVPKALYSLYLIYQAPGYADSVKADSLKRVILTQYPNSPFASMFTKKKTQPAESEHNALAQWSHRRFLQAERFYFRGELDSALAIYREIASRDSLSEWGAKAQLSIAWIYENDLKDNQKAILAYQEVVDRFKEFPSYYRFAYQKLLPINNPEEAQKNIQKEKQTTEETEQKSEQTVDAYGNWQQYLAEKILWRKKRFNRRLGE